MEMAVCEGVDREVECTRKKGRLQIVYIVQSAVLYCGFILSGGFILSDGFILSGNLIQFDSIILSGSFISSIQIYTFLLYTSGII